MAFGRILKEKLLNEENIVKLNEEEK